MWDELAGIRS
jgi:hypothetical protein